jgi:exopolysaccharide production protein ExoQ
MGALAVSACLLFVLYALWVDRRTEPDVSPSLWLVLIWVFLAATHNLSTWLSGGRSFDPAQAFSEGNAIDAALYFMLIVAMSAVLAQRQIDWQRLLGQNKLLALYLLYCLASVAWADESFVTFKRWFKDLACPLAALVILTDPQPARALGWILRRAALLTIPISIVLIKYVPEYGRDYTRAGTPMNVGLTSQKNDLGLNCLLAGLYFSWLILLDRSRWLSWPKALRLIGWLVLIAALYTLWLSNSQTALVCLISVVAVFAIASMGFVRRRPQRLVSIVLTVAASAWVFESVFDMSGELYALLGRDPTLTSRTDIWAVLLPFQTDPLLGTGYISFWSGERLYRLWDLTDVGINQAHNGYLEQYLNLGAIGLGLIVLLLINALHNAWRLLPTDPVMETMRVALIVMAALYNYTEASLYGITNMWLMTVLALACVPHDAVLRPSGNPDDQTAPEDKTSSSNSAQIAPFR